ncbi:permease-like cell division protein FtsX [Actinoplanes sp. NPDC026670]|uniref:permease-like cell division protein FtsX n=1 Tax=Actinoplanes sp. NPDC026670 TaxID=3154700 RepID=UPI00340E7B59
MNRDLRDRFDGAVGGDPGVPPGELAMAAIAEGSRIRRRTRIAAGVATGLVLVAGGAAGAALPWGAPDPAAPAPETIAAAMLPVSAPTCSERPVDENATDLAVFLATGATDGQRAEVEAAVHDDARVDVVVFESRDSAYERFADLWADSPDFVAALDVREFPESFRLRLVSPEQDAAVRGRLAALPGVSQIIGHTCPKSAPVGGLR